jgi:hypothetical protein
MLASVSHSLLRQLSRARWRRSAVAAAAPTRGGEHHQEACPVQSQVGALADLVLAASLTSRRSLTDLLMLSEQQRDAAVSSVRRLLGIQQLNCSPSRLPPQLGFDDAAREDFLQFVRAMPCISLAASCETEV